MLTDKELQALAGKQAFTRGRAYHTDGRVVLARRDDDRLEGEAEGTELYALWLARDGTGWRWDCSCPAADDGAFCKHLVAAALTARDDAADEPRTAGGTSRAGDDLATFLRAQPVERLASWLLALAGSDPEIDKRLRLYRATDDPAELKSALGKMLDTGGMLDYRRSIAYARRLHEVAARLEDAVARDPDSGRSLCEYVLGRLLKIYARSDDSAGAIGEQLRRIGELHQRACTALSPGKALVKPLLALQAQDDWGFFALSRYWDALGADGQTDYGRRIVAEFETLSKQPAERDRWGAAFAVERRAEAYARASGDFEFLQRVLRRRLQRPHDYMQVLASLREFDRPREALTWAEQAVKRFPTDDGLRVALADCLVAAGLDDDAIEHVWHAFHLHPDTGSWNALKRISAARWPAWRERALADVASREKGEASLRVSLLDHDGDFDAAVALAQCCPVRPDVLEELARRLQRKQPAVAGEFHLRIAKSQLPHIDTPRYPALVQNLKRAARSLPTDRWRPFVALVRAEHHRKTKLMRLLDEAGL